MDVNDPTKTQEAGASTHPSSKPKIAFVNLPHPWTIVRRYMCTYYSAMMKLAPYELLQLATCAREWHGAEVFFLDAIAEECGEGEVHAFITEHSPDILVALIGVDTVSEDLACADRIKVAFPHVTIVVFGYYPSVLSEEVLAKTQVDAVLRYEPEETFSAYLNARSNGLSLKAIAGLAARDEDGSVFSNAAVRITDLDRLPSCDFSLCDKSKYEEWLLGGPCGAILTARGCPFTCTYCTTTYGRKWVAKKPKTVVAELKAMAGQGIRVVRFLDDTFTFSQERVIAICKGILDEGLRITWSCLGRIDTLDSEMLAWMKKAGCVRIAVGVESYSRKVLENLGKPGDPAEFNAKLQLVRDAGIECAATLLVGAPIENETDFRLTVDGLLASPVNLIGVTVIAPYAGTPFFEAMKDEVAFSLIPYECRFKDEALVKIGLEREQRLYRAFYLRPSVVMHQFGAVCRHPIQGMRLLFMLLRFGRVFRPSTK